MLLLGAVGGWCVGPGMAMGIPEKSSGGWVWRGLGWAALCVAAVCVAAEGPDRGGAGTGSMDGRLTDWHSIPLVEAVVVVRNVETGVATRGVTGKNGSYRFTGLGPGEYRLEADVPSLGKGAVEGIVVAAGHATRVQAALVMEMPVAAEPVQVERRELDPVTPAVTTMLAGEELQGLPLVSRNWGEIAGITPAANPVSTRGSGDVLAGGDAEEGEGLAMGAGFEAESSVDGMESLEGFHAGVGREDRGAGQTGGASAVGAAAVGEMRARTGNGGADSGVGAGGGISLTTGLGAGTGPAGERGRNGLHGQGFYLDRQSLWGARNPFTQWIQEISPANGIDTAQFAGEPYSPGNGKQTFGVGMGQEIRRRKMFWFGAVDGLLQSDPGVATVRHADSFFARPTDAELTVLAARLGLPSADPVDEAVTAYSAGLEELDGLLGPVPRRASQVQGFGRVDWEASEREHVSVEGAAAREDAPAGALGRSSETYGSHSFGNSRGVDGWGMARVESFLTANLLSAVGVEWRRHVQSETAQAPSAFETPLLASGWGQLPEMIADSKYGFILGKPARLGGARGSRYPDERLLAVQESLSWVRGAHLVKMGGSFDHISDRVNVLANQTGTYSYADVLNFLSDTAGYEAYGFANLSNPDAPQHNCDATGRVQQLGDGSFLGLGPLPCYAWYSQRIGPADWHLSTNDLAGFVTEQWQAAHNLTLSVGLRVEAEQLPPAIAGVANPDLPETQKLPGALSFGPRFGLAYAPWARTVLRVGAGMYFGRVDNATALAALSQTGSAHGDLNFFFKPTDEGAPPFPYVFPVAPQNAVTPGAVSFAKGFRVQEVDQGVVSVEQELPSHWVVAVSGLASLGRRLPVSVDTNLQRVVDGTGSPETISYEVVDTGGLGPIKTATVEVPLYTARVNPAYQQLASIEIRANSTYEAGMVKLTRYGGRGLNVHAHYVYAHAADWNPNEGGNVAGNGVLDPEDFRLEYGTSNLDIRHSVGATVEYAVPWKLNSWAGVVANGWTVAGIGQFRSGLPYTMRTSGYIPGYYAPTLAGGHVLIEGVGPGMNGSGGDDRLYGIGRNTYRYPATWTGDTRVGKRFNLAHNRQLELLAESFNLFNHQNVTLVETTGYYVERGSATGGGPTLNFMTGLTKAGLPSTTTVEFGKPLDVNATNFYRPREIEVGVRARF